MDDTAAAAGHSISVAHAQIFCSRVRCLGPLHHRYFPSCQWLGWKESRELAKDASGLADPPGTPTTSTADDEVMNTSHCTRLITVDISTLLQGLAGVASCGVDTHGNTAITLQAQDPPVK